MDKTRILIADDHVLFRDGLRSLIRSLSDVEVVGEASNGEQAIALAATLQPDVILMDIQMPGMNGIEATRQILHASPHIGIIVVTMFEDNDSVVAAMRAGARGYILKDAHQAEMVRAIRAIANGEALFSAAIARRMINYFAEPKPAYAMKIFPELSDR